MGDGTTDFQNLNFSTAQVGPSELLQSLPDLDNPCERIWDRYFSNSSSHKVWFQGVHHVDKKQMFVDCNNKAQEWQQGLFQIRQVHNMKEKSAQS